MYDLSIVIPTCRSAGYIYRSLSEIHAVLSLKIERIQYILINNGGGSAVETEILRFKKEHPDVVLVNFDRNYGQQPAVQKGLELAGGALIMTTDDDLQYAPSDMLRLYQHILADTHTEVYCGYSRSKHKSNQYNFSARLVTLLLNHVYFPAFRKASYYTPLKVFRRSVLFKEGQWLHRNIYYFWELDPKKMKSLDVEQRQRIGGSSNSHLGTYLFFFRHIMAKMALITMLVLTFITGSAGWLVMPFKMWLIVLAIELCLIIVIKKLMIHFRKYKFQVSSIVQ